MKQYRHGDLLLVAVEAIPEGAKLQKKRKVLAEGEATGHAHTLFGPGTLYLVDGQLYLRAPKATAVVHEEHAKITLPAGLYRIDHQREYRPAAAPRRVVD